MLLTAQARFSIWLHFRDARIVPSSPCIKSKHSIKLLSTTMIHIYQCFSSRATLTSTGWSCVGNKFHERDISFLSYSLNNAFIPDDSNFFNKSGRSRLIVNPKFLSMQTKDIRLIRHIRLTYQFALERDRPRLWSIPSNYPDMIKQDSSKTKLVSFSSPCLLLQVASVRGACWIAFCSILLDWVF